MLPDLLRGSPAQSNFVIRQSQKEEIDLINELKDLENICPGLYDFNAFQFLDNYQLWTGLIDNKPIALCGSVVYDSGVAYIGSYFVRKQFRGQGYGVKIWNFVLSKLKDVNLALNGNPKLQENYKKLGFKTESYGIRFMLKGSNSKHESKFLIDCKEVDFNLLKEYDSKNFPGSREKFLEAWITLPKCKAIAFVREKKIEGYGVLRASHKGYKIGPLFANDYDVAVQILQSLRSQVSEQTQIIFQTAFPHQDALRLSKEFKMEKIFTNPRMFTKEEPQVFKKKTIYSITSPEFG